MWGDPGQRGNAQNYCGNNPVNRVDPLGLESPEEALERMQDKEGWVLPSWNSIATGVVNLGHGILEPAYVVHDTIVVTGNFLLPNDMQAYDKDLPLASSLGNRFRDNVAQGKGAGSHVRAAAVFVLALPSGGAVPLADSVATVFEEDMSPQQAADHLGAGATTQTLGAALAVTAAKGTGRSPGGKVEVSLKSNNGKSHSSIAATVEPKGGASGSRNYASSSLTAPNGVTGPFAFFRNLWRATTEVGPDLGFTGGLRIFDSWLGRGRALATSVLEQINAMRPNPMKSYDGGTYGPLNNCHGHVLGLWARGSFSELLFGFRSKGPVRAAGAQPCGSGEDGAGFWRDFFGG